MSVDVPVIRTERLLLTIPGARAAEAFARFNRENAAHLAPWSPAMTDRDFDVGVLRETLDRQITLFREDRRYAFCIFGRETGADGPLLGYLNFNEVVRGVFQACYMGYALAGEAQGHGFMTEACRAGIAYAFNEARLHPDHGELHAGQCAQCGRPGSSGFHDRRHREGLPVLGGRVARPRVDVADKPRRRGAGADHGVNAAIIAPPEARSGCESYPIAIYGRPSSS